MKVVIVKLMLNKPKPMVVAILDGKTKRQYSGLAVSEVQTAIQLNGTGDVARREIGIIMRKHIKTQDVIFVQFADMVNDNMIEEIT